MPDEFDIDESITGSRDVIVTNLQWGNLVNLSDDSYGIENLPLRPARLNTSSLLVRPLQGAVYGSDGRVTSLDDNYAYVKYRDGTFFISNNTYGVRAIASYTSDKVSDTTQLAYEEKLKALDDAHNKVNLEYSVIPGKFVGMQKMISAYGQGQVDGNINSVDFGDYLKSMVDCYKAMYQAMEAQKDVYVALANLQNFLYRQGQGLTHQDLTWEQLEQNQATYNADGAVGATDAQPIALTGLSQYITDLAKVKEDLETLTLYAADRAANKTAYYWNSKGESAPGGRQISAIVNDLLNMNTMKLDIKQDGEGLPLNTILGNKSAYLEDLMGAVGKERNVYVSQCIMSRFEKLAVDSNYRVKTNNGQRTVCPVTVTYVVSVTIYGVVQTDADGDCDIWTVRNIINNSNSLAPEGIAQDTYGLVIDIWARTNAEQTCLTLEGATTTDEAGNIMSYDGVNRVWGSTGEAVLTTDSTTQGGGSCYIYYADTPEDMMRSLELLKAMKVAFVDEYGTLMARASMDTANYYAVNGRITVPLVLDSDTKTTYTYINEMNEEKIGRAITTMYTDTPIRIETIVYLDGDWLTNDDVLAAAEIQGQLNLQFGSSTNLKTVGSNELIDDIRSVTAELTKSEMDYDIAQGEDDLTTDVTVTVKGTNPQKVTAFFVRAINSTQGTRERAMDFTKAGEDTWVSQYTFTAPGTYYLRYVRLDGVDYALEAPLQVEVKGFKLDSVTWDQGSESTKVVRISDNTYPVKVSAKFAASDRSKLPTSVQARFMRSDGNMVNIPLSYSSTTGQWSGTGTFSTSGEYTLKYLVYTSNSKDYYKDLAPQNLTKTLDLSLGMYVAVYQNGGELTEEYESGRTYSKDVLVEIFDNTGKEMEALEGLTLIYSNGGSVTDTVPPAPLTWNETNGYYEAQLGIAKPGRYTFASVKLEGGYLTKCTESPVYTIISPEPPIYDETSACTYNGNNIQFVPLTNDAVIDNIKIANAESAAITAVLYNDKTGQYYTRDSASGAVYVTGSAWSVKLPTYTLDVDANGNPLPDAVYTQDGTWSLAALMLTGCYDADRNLRGEDNPIIWAGSDSIASDFLSANHLTADATYDFSKLSTQVSCSIKVSFVSGNTTLGSSNAEFMTRYSVKGLGMYALLTDDAGNIIPSSKISDVTLNVSYTPPTTDKTYGYMVQAGAGDTYDIELNTQDAESGHRTVSLVKDLNDYDWQYVGVYSVQDLQVTIKGGDGKTFTKTYKVKDNIGLPSAYTIYSKGPSGNIELDEAACSLGNRTFGMVGQSVTGTFLQSYKPGMTGKIALTTDDPNDNLEYVILDNVTMQVKLTYQGGGDQYCKYTINGINYSNEVTLDLKNTSGIYRCESETPLLPGTYTATLIAKVGTDTEITKTFNETISVYAKQPTLKVTGVSPSTSTTFKMNTYFGNGVAAYENADLVEVQNFYSDTLANVYIKAEPAETQEGYPELVHYTLPTVTLMLSDVGDKFSSAMIELTNSAEAFSFTPNALTSTKAIGKIGTDTITYVDTSGCGNEIPVEYETRTAVGEQTISSIVVTDENGTEYTLHTSAVTIREKNEAPASITYAEVSGFTKPDSEISLDGSPLTVTLPTDIGTEVRTYEVTDDSVDWTEISNGNEKLMYYDPNSIKYSNDTPYNSNTSGCGDPVWHYPCTATITYHLYIRTTIIREKTATTMTYRGKYGVVKWVVGGVEHDPGEAITVNGAVTATPKIGLIPGTEESFGTPRYTTTMWTYITDKIDTTYSKDGTYTGQKTVDVTTSTADARREAAKGYNDNDCKPRDYKWFDINDPTSDKHYTSPYDKTEEKN